MVITQEWLKLVDKGLTKVINEFDPPQNGIWLEEALITPEQFHAIKRQVVANVAYRSGMGDLQQKTKQIMA